MSSKKKIETERDIKQAFPALVSDNPWKIISLLLVVTLVMGYFASHAEMETEEETFEPDTETAIWMDQVEEEFGTTGEVVQIVFIGDRGDSLNQDVLLDMHRTKEAFFEEEKINETLMETDDFPDGMITLADLIIQANQTQELTRSLEIIDEDLDGFHTSLKNQTQMYGKLNSSLRNNRILALSPEPEIRNESTETFRSMSNIVSNPESWAVFSEYVDLFETIIDLIEDEGDTPIPTPLEGHPSKSGTAELRAIIAEEDNGENETIPEEGEYFLELFSASLSIVTHEEATTLERQATAEMLADFLEVGDHIANIRPDFDFLEEIPSIDLSHEEKGEKLENMTDRDVKRSLEELHRYDPDPLQESIERSRDILADGEELGEEATKNLTDTEKILRDIDDIYRETEGIDHEEMDPYVDNYSSTLGYMFSLNRTEYEGYLEEGTIHEKLREAFEEEGHEVGENATLSKEERWRVLWIGEDGEEKEYQIEKSDEELKVTRGGYVELLRGTRRVIEDLTSLMESAEYLPEVINDMARLTVSFSSQEFDGRDLTPRRIKATSGMGLVQMNTSMDSDTRLEAQQEVIELSEEVSKNSETRVYAPEVMLEEINESALRSISRLLPIAFIFVVIVLMLIYRSIVETFLSLSSLGTAIVWTFGAGVILGYKFNRLIVAVPILITGLVIDYGIHMVMRYREEKKKTGDPSSSTRIAIMTVGGALLLTTITTSVGFLSNLLGDIEVIRQFGVLAAVGISSSLILMIGFLPAALQIIEEKRSSDKTRSSSKDEESKKSHQDRVKSLLSISSTIAYEKPWVMIVATLMITTTAAYGAINVDTTFNIEDFLPEGRPQSENIDYVNANYNISTSDVYMIVEGDVEETDFLYALDHLKFNSRDNRYIMHDHGINSPLSVIQDYGTATVGQDHFNESLVEAFEESDTTGNEIPDENITALYDKLYEAPESRDAIRQVLSRSGNGEYRSALVSFTENEELITEDLDRASDMRDRLEEDAEPLKNLGYDIKITGNNLVRHETTEELTQTQIQSLGLTILIVAVLLTFIFYASQRSKVLGVITTFPVTLVTLWIVGTMYVLDVPLNVLTVTITALTVGMGVDYSIHISHRFLEEINEKDDLFQAMQVTVKNTGSALFGSAATTVGAFSILSASDIIPLSQFGYITAIAIAYSFIVAVFLLPSALMIWAKLRDDTEVSRKNEQKTLFDERFIEEEE